MESVRSYLLQRDSEANPLSLMTSGTGVTALEPRRTLSGFQSPTCPFAGPVLAQMWEESAPCLWLSQDGSWNSSPGHCLPFYYLLRFFNLCAWVFSSLKWGLRLSFWLGDSEVRWGYFCGPCTAIMPIRSTEVHEMSKEPGAHHGQALGFLSLDCNSAQTQNLVQIFWGCGITVLYTFVLSTSSKQCAHIHTYMCVVLKRHLDRLQLTVPPGNLILLHT